jgi:hypothetical protein
VGPKGRIARWSGIAPDSAARRDSERPR